MEWDDNFNYQNTALDRGRIKTASKARAYNFVQEAEEDGYYRDIGAGVTRAAAWIEALAIDDSLCNGNKSLATWRQSSLNRFASSRLDSGVCPICRQGTSFFQNSAWCYCAEGQRERHVQETQSGATIFDIVS